MTRTIVRWCALLLLPTRLSVPRSRSALNIWIRFFLEWLMWKENFTIAKEMPFWGTDILIVVAFFYYVKRSLLTSDISIIIEYNDKDRFSKSLFAMQNYSRFDFFFVTHTFWLYIFLSFYVCFVSIGGEIFNSRQLTLNSPKLSPHAFLCRRGV